MKTSLRAIRSSTAALILAAVGALILSACSSTPTRYYTLLSAAGSAAAASPAPYAIDLSSVTVPSQVDTRPLVLRAGNGQLAIEDGHEWAAPLPDEVRQALSHDLTRDLGAEDLYGLPHGDNLPVYRVRVAITRFDSIYGGAAVIGARWSISAPSSGDGKTLTCSSRQQQAVSAGYDALVQGHQRALASLAAEIAAVVRAMPSGAAVCPVSR